MFTLGADREFAPPFSPLLTPMFLDLITMRRQNSMSAESSTLYPYG
jgi:hypothetical protein